MDFQKLFIDYHIPYSTRINKGWVNSNCPFCDTKADSFNMGFNPSRNYCHCWKCGGNNLNKTLQVLLNVPFHELPEIIAGYEDRAGIVNNLNGKKIARAKQLSLPSNTLTLAERKYLTSRGYSPRFLHDKYNIVGGGIAGPWKYRIIVPLYYNHKLVSWTGRSILSKDEIKRLRIPRYKNLSIEDSVINPKECLFNIDNCTKDIGVLTEGAFDVMRFGDDFFCSFGTELTQTQVKIISERFRKIYVMFDNEVEAQKKARKFGAQIASLGVEVEVVEAYSDFNKNDGGELNPDEVKVIRKELNL